jgi:hypothetical protein
MKKMDMSWLRFQMLWSNVQPNGPGSFHWDSYDQAIGDMRGSGIHLLAVLTMPPAWARASGCNSQYQCPPADPAAFASFAGAMVDRYKADVHSWEVLNEPNIDGGWGMAPDPAAYARVLKATYAAIKKADPTATVVTAGLSPAGTVPGKYIAPTEFLQAMYSAGAGGSFDAVGWHPYTVPSSPPGTFDQGSAWSQMSETTSNARSIMGKHGDADKRIWATEFGMSTAPSVGTQAQQADMLTSAIKEWSTYSFGGPLFLYNFRDKGTDGSDKENLYGLVNTVGTPKPAVAAVATEMKAVDG